MIMITMIGIGPEMLMATTVTLMVLLYENKSSLHEQEIDFGSLDH